MLTELGGSQVEVQRCSLSSDGPRFEVQRCPPLSSEGPRLRSSGAQCAQTLAVEVQQCPLRADTCGSWRRAWRRVGKAEVNMEVEAEVVEEKEEEKKEEEEKEKNNSDKI